MPSYITKSQVNQLNAGADLDERTAWALLVLKCDQLGWPDSSILDWLREILGIPSRPTGWPVYCGVEYSATDPGVLEEVFTGVDRTFPNQPESVAMCRWIVCEAMDVLGMS